MRVTAAGEAEETLQEALRPAKKVSLGKCCGECIQTRGTRCIACYIRQEETHEEPVEKDKQELESSEFDFDSLGPPPPCPKLCRQDATDFTETRERKRADFNSRDAVERAVSLSGTVQTSRLHRRLPAPEHYPLSM